jgi:hypothetical protein
MNRLNLRIGQMDIALTMTMMATTKTHMTQRMRVRRRGKAPAPEVASLFPGSQWGENIAALLAACYWRLGAPRANGVLQCPSQRAGYKKMELSLGYAQEPRYRPMPDAAHILSHL